MQSHIWHVEFVKSKGLWGDENFSKHPVKKRLEELEAEGWEILSVSLGQHPSACFVVCKKPVKI